jgi:cell division protein ZapA
LAQLTIKINGYAYTVGCEDGQEQHLQAMCEQVEKRIESIKALGGNSGEARLLVLAALLMADEIHDLRIETDSLRTAAAKPARIKAEGAKPDAGTIRADQDLTRKLGRLAIRAEQIAAGLEQP